MDLTERSKNKAAQIGAQDVNHKVEGTQSKHDGRVAQRLAVVKRGAALYGEALEQLGVGKTSLRRTEFVNQPYADLREPALLEKYQPGKGAYSS
jgi:hypothetical protein